MVVDTSVGVLIVQKSQKLILTLISHDNQLHVRRRIWALVFPQGFQ